MKHLFRLLLLGVILLSSCVKYEEIEINDVKLKSFEMTAPTTMKVKFSVTVDNPTKTDVSLLSFIGEICKEGSQFANVTLDEAVKAKAGSVSENELSADVRLTDPLALLTTGINMKNWDANEFTINGKAVFKNGRGIRKSVKFKDLPIDRAIKKLIN